jgi:hypothetical protein
VGVIPDDVQQEIVDRVGGVAEALARNAMEEARTFFDPEAVIWLRDDDTVKERSWSLDQLAAYFAKGGQMAVDVRALRDIRPANRDVVARFAADVVMSRDPWAQPVPRELEIVLRPPYDSEPRRLPGEWSIRSVRM